MNANARFASTVSGLLLLLLAPVAPAQDLALIAITAPTSGCALGSSEAVSIRILNYGPTLPAGTSILVLYTVSGSPSVNDTVVLAQSLPTQTSVVHTFAVPADLSVPGTYEFNASINPAGDLNPGNNNFTGYIVVNSAPTMAGTLAGPASGSSGTLTLSGTLGTVLQWEESPDNLRWFKLHNTGSTQSFADLRATTRYRVRVANAPCAAAVSNVHVVQAP